MKDKFWRFCRSWQYPLTTMDRNNVSASLPQAQNATCLSGFSTLCAAHIDLNIATIAGLLGDASQSDLGLRV